MNYELQTAATQPSRFAHRAGDTIGGKYRLVRKMGEGAMGAVWVATQAGLDRQVAIKLAHPHLSCRELGQRLLREARLAATLDEPAIVRVFDAGETRDGTTYVVMEMLLGEELRSVLCREKRLAPELALQLLLPIARGMAAAHSLGIIHRDLKPENIVLARGVGSGIVPKVVDFGVAKRGKNQESLFGRGPVGTPEYMPPEQLLCLDVDRRADVFAFCAVVYEAIAGRTPYPGTCLTDAIEAVVLGPPPPRLSTLSSADEALSELIDRGLRREPAARWQSMHALGRALASWLSARGVKNDITGMSLLANWGPLEIVPEPGGSTPYELDALVPERVEPDRSADPDLTDPDPEGATTLDSSIQELSPIQRSPKRVRSAFGLALAIGATAAGIALLSEQPLAHRVRAATATAVGLPNDTFDGARWWFDTRLERGLVRTGIAAMLGRRSIAPLARSSAVAAIASALPEATPPEPAEKEHAQPKPSQAPRGDAPKARDEAAAEPYE